MKRQKVVVAPIQWPSLLFEDRFFIRNVDNLKYEKVGRIRGKSTGFDAEIILDVNTDVYPISEKENLTIGISTSVAPVKSEPKTTHQLIDTSELREETLMDQYEYVMYGKIFRVEDKAPDKRAIYASFGGLLMSLTAERQVVSELQLDLRIYLLVRRKQEF